MRFSAPAADSAESEIWLDGEVDEGFVLPIPGGGPTGLGQWYDVVVIGD